MNKQFSDNAWNDLMEWQREDRKIVKKIADLLNDIERNGHEGKSPRVSGQSCRGRYVLL